MSDYEYHKGKLKRVDLAEFDNDREKYFETRYRYEFAVDENRSNGMTEEEIQEAYQQSVKNKYRRRGPWEDLWKCNTDDYEGVIIIGDDIWEVADIELNDNEDVFTKISLLVIAYRKGRTLIRRNYACCNIFYGSKSIFAKRSTTEKTQDVQ